MTAGWSERSPHEQPRPLLTLFSSGEFRLSAIRRLSRTLSSANLLESEVPIAETLYGGCLPHSAGYSAI
jgi:hypothetical protein